MPSCSTKRCIELLSLNDVLWVLTPEENQNKKSIFDWSQKYNIFIEERRNYDASN